MVFPEDGLSVFIDPSYFCTGIWAVAPSRKRGWFSAVSNPSTKRTLQGYWTSAQGLAREFSWRVHDLIVNSFERRKARFGFKTLWEPDSVTVVMEAPFPGGHSSPGLYGLQFLFLERLECGTTGAGGMPYSFYSLPPSFIHGQFKRECGEDKPRIRKEWVKAKCDEMAEDGWVIEGLDGLSHKGCDRQTAFGFWWFLSHGDKELEPFQLELNDNS